MSLTITPNTIPTKIGVEDGSAASPSLYNIGDADTGVFFPADNTIAFTGGGAESMRITSSGNLQLGFTGSSINDLYILKNKPADSVNAVIANSSTATFSQATITALCGSVNAFVNATTSQVRLGSTGGAFPVLFQTNGVERMRITATGDVGIGTSSPANKLHVTGTGSTPTLFERTGSNGVYLQLKDASGASVFLGADNGVFAVQTPGSSYSDKLVVDSSGNVGIGTSSPDAKLRVNGAAKVGEGVASNTSKLMVNTVSGVAAGIQLFQDANESWIIQNPASTTALTFGNSGTERMRIDSSGNVGIGTTTMTGKLNVATAGDAVQIQATNGTIGARVAYITSGVAYTGTSTSSPWGVLTADTERMRIDSSGNVGIGTSSPAYKLDVLIGAGSGSLFRAGQSGVSNGYTITSNGTALTHFWATTGEAMRLDSAGNLGLGVTPSAWDRPAYQSTQNLAVLGLSNTSNLAQNAYFNAGWKYMTSAAAADFQVAQGAFYWFTAPSGTAGNAISFTQAMTLDSSGNLGIGTTSPLQQLHLSSASATGMQITYQGVGASRIGIAAGNLLTFGLDTSNGTTTRMTIDSSGNLGLGVTPSAWSGYNAIQVGQVGALWANPSGTDVYWSANYYYGAGADRYIANGLASYYRQSAGVHSWGVAGSGTAGNAISFTQAMTLGSDGNLAVGSASTGNARVFSYINDAALPAIVARQDGAAPIQTWQGPSGGEKARITSGGDLLVGTTANTESAKLNVQGGYIFLKETNGGDVYLRSGFGAGTDPAIQVASNDPLLFVTNNTERARIDASGDFIVGGTTTNSIRLTAEKSNPTRGIIAHVSNSGSSGLTGSQIMFTQNTVNNWAVGQPAGVDAFAFWSGRNTAADGTERMRIDASGNLGVGIAAPSTKLHVSGGVLRTNTRVTNSQNYPLGHYSPGECVFEVDPTWTEAELQAFFQTSAVTWAAVADAPGGYCIYIDGAVYVGGVYNSGFPYIPVDTSDVYYMECWIQNVGSNQGHYMGSIDYDQNFASLGGNPGSFGYWVMSNTDPGNTWTKVSGYIQGFGTATGQFVAGTKYWTPQALFNYTPGTGTRACRISGWKVIRAYQPGNRFFSGNVGIGQSSPALQSGGTGITLYGSSASEIKFLNSTTGSSASDGTALVTSGADFVINNREAGAVTFGTSNTERMRVTSAGNVGIGTASPLDRLEVSGGNIYLGYATTTTQENALLGFLKTDQFTANGLSIPAYGLKWGTISGGAVGLHMSGYGGVLLYSGNTERMRLDSAGNLGLGVTPSAWGAAYRALEFGGGGSALFSGTSGTAQTYLTANAYFDGTNWVYKNTAIASFYEQSGGAHRWHTAPSGTAGNAISFTQAMTLDASGNLLVGQTSSISGKLQVSGAGGMRVNEDGAGTKVVFVRSDYAGLGPAIQVSTSDPLLFLTSNTERARIDASGNLGVGTSSPNTRLEVSGAEAIVSLRVNTANSGISASNYSEIQLSDLGAVRAFWRSLRDGSGKTAFAYNNHLAFLSDGGGTPTERMRITSAGDVGIGTASPVGKLGVAGSQTVGFNAGLTGSPEAGNLFYTTDGTGWQFRIGKYQSGAFTSQMVLTDAGNVLIGKTASTYSAANRTCLEVAGAANAVFELKGGTSSHYIYNDGTNWQQVVTNAGYQSFYTNNLERMRIDSSGNVGIGTSSPATLLHVNGSNSIARFSGASTSLSAYQTFFNNSAAQAYFGIESSTGTGIIGTGAAYGMVLSTASTNPLVFGVNNAERARFTEYGDLLIGTTSRSGLTGFSGGAVGQVIQSGVPVLALVDSDNTTDSVVWLANSSGVGYLYTKAANPFVFGTNGLEKMRLTEAGNLLLGKSGSSYATTNRTCLEIAGTSTAVIGVKGGTSNYYIYNDGTNLFQVLSNAGAQVFYTNDVESMRVTATGNTQTIGGIYDANAIRIANPKGAHYVTTSSSISGAIKIVLPVAGSNTMIRMTVRIYEYSTGYSFDMHLGGYNYNDVSYTWYNVYAYAVGSPSINRQFSVRFGYDSVAGKNVIYIGELSSSWSYPQVYVTDVQLGYSGYSDTWAYNWSIGFETSAFAGVTQTVTNPQVGYQATAGDAVQGSVKYTSTTNTAGCFYGGTTTPTGTTRLNYSGYLYPTFLNLEGSADTSTAATHYFVETGTDGYVRPKTLANVQAEIVTTAAVSSATAAGAIAFAAGTVSAPAIYPTGDTNTGFYFPASDTVSAATGGAEVFRIGSDKHVYTYGGNDKGYKSSSDVAWTSFTMLNSYTQNGTRPFQYRRIGNMVEVGGIFEKAVGATFGQTVATLPSGTRPTKRIYVAGFASTDTYPLGLLSGFEIDTNGDVIISLPTAAGANYSGQFNFTFTCIS